MAARRRVFSTLPLRSPPLNCQNSVLRFSRIAEIAAEGIHIAGAKGEGARSARAAASLRSPPSGGEEGTLAPYPRSHRERDRLECFGLS